MWPLILIFSSLFFILAWRRLDQALYFLIVFLPTYQLRFAWLGIPSTLLELMILISFFAFSLKYLLPHFKNVWQKKTKIQPYPFSFEIISIIIISFLAAGVAGFNSGALGIWKAYFFEPLLVFIMIINVFSKNGKWQKIINTFLLSALGISFIAIYQKITGKLIPNEFWANFDTRRVTSIFEYPNAVGLFLAPLIPLFLSLFLVKEKKLTIAFLFKKIFLISGIILSLLAIIFAKSIGALVGLAVGLFIFGLFFNKKSRFLSLGMFFIILVSFFTIPFVKENVGNKLLFQDLSGQIRLQQWRETNQALTGLKIITGFGLNNYQTTILPYHQEGIFFNRDKIENFHAVTWASSTLQQKYWQPVEIYLYPHNIFLNFWTELGLLGLLVFIWLIGKIYFTLFRLQRNTVKNSVDHLLSLGLISSFVVIIIHGLVDVPYFKNDLAVIFWLLVAMTGLLSLKNPKHSLLK